MLKAEFFDNCYLQQNAFDDVDGATPRKRQQFVFDKVLQVLDLEIEFENKDEARRIMVAASDLFRNWNYAAWDVSRDEGEEAADGGEKEEGAKEAPRTAGMSEEFKQILDQIERFIESKGQVAREDGETEEAVEAK
jgi:vacuolar-type H+-ATPase catalytic subunit A/Vma1